MSFPVIDLHCDMTVYMIEKKDASPLNAHDIGSAIPHLKNGNVIAQVMAFFTPASPVQHGFAMRQAKIFKKFQKDYPESFTEQELKSGKQILPDSKTVLLPSIENASGFCHEDERLDDGLKNLEEIIELTGGIFYIGFMHFGDNRFGGSAGSTVGLKDDGKVLLDYLNSRHIAVDLSHAGDNLAHDIFTYVDNKNLDIPIIASHSNFRRVKNHSRNLTDELAKELISRNALIGINFMQAYLGEDDPDVIFDHIEYGLNLGAENTLCLGADFFWDENRAQDQIYYKKFISASTYPVLLEEVEKRFSNEIAEKIAWKNAASFIEKF
ncbi:MAG: membrane dipeptidase [Calditrichae bacterium]|nr:membrane dipeptidase [Calditrichia bacterium]